MNENPEERHARQILESVGFAVTRIPESEGRPSADYYAEKGSSRVLVEVTDKKETEFFAGLRQKALQEGLATASRPVGRWNTIDGIVKDKARQLAETEGYDGCLRVLWMSALHDDASYVISAARRTLYGLQNLLVIERDIQLMVMPCYYYEHNSFIKVPELDAVVLSTGEGGRLCVNEFSANADRVLTSKLMTLLPSEAVCDPKREEREGLVFRLGSSLDRTDEKAKHAFLFKKYGAKTTVFQGHEFRGICMNLGSLI